MGFGYYKKKNSDYDIATEYQKKEEIGNEFLHSYNDPIIDKFLTYLHQVYLQSQTEETARSFQVKNFTIIQEKKVSIQPVTYEKSKSIENTHRHSEGKYKIH